MNSLKRPLTFAAVGILLGAPHLLPPASAGTISEDMKQEDLANDRCREGRGTQYCREREALLKSLAARGWCWGHEGEIGADKDWERCQSHEAPAARRQVFPDAGRAYLAMSRWWLGSQLHACDQFETAGNVQLAAECRNRLGNANDYLTAHAEKSVIPAVGWAICQSVLSQDMDLGARCVTAVEQVCRFDGGGQLTNTTDCYSMVNSGTYVTNPVAQRLSFDRPIR